MVSINQILLYLQSPDAHLKNTLFHKYIPTLTWGEIFPQLLSLVLLYRGHDLWISTCDPNEIFSDCMKDYLLLLKHDHTLVKWLSCTDHVANPAVISCLNDRDHVPNQELITWL